jgi:hypothetical protein
LLKKNISIDYLTQKIIFPLFFIYHLNNINSYKIFEFGPKNIFNSTGIKLLSNSNLDTFDSILNNQKKLNFYFPQFDTSYEVYGIDSVKYRTLMENLKLNLNTNDTIASCAKKNIIKFHLKAITKDIKSKNNSYYFYTENNFKLFKVSYKRLNKNTQVLFSEVVVFKYL